MADKQTLADLSATARQLANDLFRTDAVACSQCAAGKSPCVQAEHDRPLTRDEKRQGWAARPFYALDTERMCAGCRAYYFAEMAAQTLNEMRCWQRRAEAEAVQAARK